jgi:hypothetical protein
VSISTFIQAVEAALAELRERLFVSLEFEHEHRDDLAGFGTQVTGAEELQRQGRHLEWFLLERTSEVLGAVPLERFFDGLDEGEVTSAAAVYASLRGSRTGVFRVARVVDQDGLLLDDLLGRGQYAVPDAVLVSEFTPGDLVVGRLYPEDLGEDGERTLWGLSSSATSFRNPKLLVALERDLEAMRARTRGPLRMTQADIEAMFFCEQVHVETPLEPAAASDAPRMRRAALELLEDQGVTPARAEEFLSVLAAHPLPELDAAIGADDPLGWILDELAFETDVELEVARRVLTEYWHAAGAVVVEADTVGEPDAPEEAKAAEALARFDAGRAAGQDLDTLFAELESELGLEPDASPVVAGIPKEALEEGTDGGPAPDFPGVLSALVQEFLWDGARMAELDVGDFAREHRDLELFVQFGSFIGNADELGPKHIELFLGRWIWEEQRLAHGAYCAAGAVRSTRAFCVWLATSHEHDILTDVEEFLGAVEVDAARIEAP